MYNHEPEKYNCPFCAIVNGIEGDFPYTKQDDIFYSDNEITAFIASHWWPNNPGHVIIIPNSHFENLYDLPDKLLFSIDRFAKKVAVALKSTYGCNGVSLRQHNEPEGNQDVWHYHLHIFPRYENDNLYELNSEKKLSLPEERTQYADKLRENFKYKK